mmetsp:Transcript_66228/g.129813  ORF Transcript_66228/g.129813 Transcript_66228/m.129813 type:complete len:86 (-) Transcript_66228:72-329(-)
MVTAKGLKGGERALPSSFAMSAAAFGRTGQVVMLTGSEQKNVPETGVNNGGDAGGGGGTGSGERNKKDRDGDTCDCSWLDIASFS